MDDGSLDDFFAKKDKSKKKSKSSKIVPGDILEKVEEPVKKEKKKKAKDKTQAASNTAKDSKTIGITVNPEEEEEWKEIEEEKEKDYSGLRIANLQVSDKETEESEEQIEENIEEEDEEGEGRKKDTSQQGPWAVVDGAPQPPPAPKPVEPQPVETPTEESKPVGKYVPPSQRAAAAAGASGASPGPTVPAHLRKKKAAPNLKSEEDFPTLGGGTMPVQQDSDPRSFERVQHGGRQLDDPTKSAQQLSLGNKFSALQD